MTREDAYALGNIIHQEVIAFYESQFNEIFKKCNIYPQYRSFRGNTNIRSKLINPIYNEHKIALKELKAENLVETEMFNKVMKAKDEEIKKLKSIISQVAFGE